MRLWLHLRHSRGYGVHSPMLYRIIREAMMPRRVKDGKHALYDALLARGVSRRTATRLQNLFCVEGYRAWRIDEDGEDGELVVLTSECPQRVVEEVAGRLSKREGVVCILRKMTNLQRRALCKSLVESHHSMSAEGPTMLLLFARHDLRKQHIII